MVEVAVPLSGMFTGNVEVRLIDYGLNCYKKIQPQSILDSVNVDANGSEWEQIPGTVWFRG